MGLRTLRRALWLGASCVAQKMSKFRWDCLHLLVLLEGLGIKPHQTCLIHVRQERGFILFGNILPVSLMVPVFAELMGIVTLLLVRAEIQADFVLELAFVGQGLGRGSSFLDTKESHF
jgi:hypothetical protein